MRQIYKLAVLALIVQMAYAQTTMDSRLTALGNALRENTVSTIVVLRLADDISTRVAVTPQVLREAHSPTKRYTIEINASRTTLLMNWIKETKFNPRKFSPDCRWGLLFVDRNGKEIGSIFSDKFGMAGNVDGHDVDFVDGRLLDTIHAVVGSEVH